MESDVPGFLKWADSRGIQLQTSVEVRDSALGGLGIFAKSAINEDQIVLRVPKASVLDLKTLLGLVERLKIADGSDQVSAILNSALQAGGHLSETIIIRSFIWGLTVLDLNEDYTGCAEFDALSPYLKVLRTTPTLDVDESADTADPLIRELISEKALVQSDYTSLIEILPQIAELMDFPQAFQLHQAVKSRVLEIPEAETDLDEYEYSTHITLVPVLDFANHCHANNAVFDVDPMSNDVILRVVKSVAALKEITISYDPVNSVNKFLKTYGFVPEAPQLLTWEISDLDSLVNQVTDAPPAHNYTKIAKWLQVLPKLAITINDHKHVEINTEDFRLPLLLVPGLEYYASWNQELADIAEEFEATSEEETRQIIAELTRQETHAPIIEGSDTAFGVTWENNYISISNILLQTGTHSQASLRPVVTRAAALVRLAASRPSQPSTMAVGATSEKTHRPLQQYTSLRDVTLQRLRETPLEILESAILSAMESFRNDD